MAESAVYVYEGTDRSGKKTKGTITGVNPQAVKVELRKQGINARKVTRKSESILTKLGSAGGKVTSGDVTLFTRQMATMMSGRAACSVLRYRRGGWTTPSCAIW